MKVIDVYEANLKGIMDAKARKLHLLPLVSMLISKNTSYLGSLLNYLISNRLITEVCLFSDPIVSP